MKKILVLLGVIVVILVAAVFYIGSNLDRIVQGVIQRVGSEALGVPVTVGAVELDLKGGRGSIRGFEIANPPGYGREAALKFDELTLQLDAEANSIDLIRAAGPEIRVESQGETNNFDELLADLGDSGSVEAEASEVTDDTGEPVEIRIDRIEIEAALTFENLRGTSEEIANQILRQVLSHVTDAVKQATREAVNEAVDQKKEEAKEGLEDKLRERTPSTM